jgi:hypothetical protein
VAAFSHVGGLMTSSLGELVLWLSVIVLVISSWGLMILAVKAYILVRNAKEYQASINPSPTEVGEVSIAHSEVRDGEEVQGR